MIAVVCWLWGDKYSVRHVAVLAAMVGRHLPVPHRFHCIADRTVDLPAGVRAMPMPAELRGMPGESRRLWVLSHRAGALLGERILNLDLDLAVTGDLTALVTRHEPFVIWRSESVGPQGYALNPSVMLLAAGAQAAIYDRFRRDPRGELAAARNAGFTGTEQAIIGYRLAGTPVPVWTDADGIVSYRSLMTRTDRDLLPPAGTRIVSFHGRRDPSDSALQARAPWIREHWRT